MPIKRNDRWGARIFDPATGRQIWLGSYDRKKDAELREREAKRDLDLGQFAQPKRIGFADFVERWFATLAVRDSSRADYRNTCRHLVARFGNRTLNTITSEEIDAFLADFGRTHAPASVRKTATRLRQIMKRAVSWGYLAASPALDLANVPRAPKSTAQRIIDPEQVRTLLAAAVPYWRPLFLTAVSTGLRRGELFGLTWDDVLWAERKVRVSHQLQGGGLWSRSPSLPSAASMRARSFWRLWPSTSACAPRPTWDSCSPRRAADRYTRRTGTAMSGSPQPGAHCSPISHCTTFGTPTRAP